MPERTPNGRFRIGVDGRAFSSPAGGVRRYVWELYRALSRVAPDVDVVAIGAAHGDALPQGVAGYPARSFPTNLGWMALSRPLARTRGSAHDEVGGRGSAYPPKRGARRRGVGGRGSGIGDRDQLDGPAETCTCGDRSRRRWRSRREGSCGG